jgi:CubicO group peptidase (beta-lactamase class C family)
VGGVAGHAGLFGTAYDMARFGQAWLVESDNLPIESQWMHAAKQEQAASNGQRRGLGWMLKSTQDVPCGIHFSEASYGHTGFTGTSLWIDPTRQLVVACMTNRVYFGRDGQGILAFRQVLHDLLVKLIAP